MQYSRHSGGDVVYFVSLIVPVALPDSKQRFLVFHFFEISPVK